MLDDITRTHIMLNIKCLTPDDAIIKEYGITQGALKALKNEYEKIKQLLVGLKSISEIADEIKNTDNYVETIRHIIETDADELLDEIDQAKRLEQSAYQEPSKPDTADPPQEDPPPKEEDPQESPDTSDDDIPAEDNGAEKKRGRPKKGTNGGDTKDATKNLETRLKKTAETETAAVLVEDAGGIGKSLSLQRQDIGKYVMEQMGTVAMQFGYKDFKSFIDMVYSFFVQNYGRVDELQEQIEELTIINQQLQELIDQDIFRMFIAKSLDRVTIAALIGGGKINLETLFAYKRMLEASGNGIYQNNGGIEEYGN